MQKFGSQAPRDLLDEMRAIAREDGRKLQSVIEEALRAYVEQRRGTYREPDAAATVPVSVVERRELYRPPPAE
jgi:metal-responsive CopG/Arc/MetJ family transcriptional regulator